MFILMLLNGLLDGSAGTYQIFETDRRNVKRRSGVNVFRKSFCTSARNADGTLSVYKSPSLKPSRRAAIDRFLRLLPLNKSFSSISDPAFTEANKVLEPLQKTFEKQATLPH